MITNKQLAEKCIDIAKNYKTLYVMGGIGYRLTEANKTRAINNGAHGSYNAKSTRKKMIQAADADTWAFDCVCLIKSVLWGWQGDKTKNYGGATYVSNNVPDIDADQMINVCKDVSTDFSKIEIGEAVWLKGHIGIYIGDGLAVECTPSWKNCVQITACNCNKNGYNRRNWTKHGKLPYITYETVKTPSIEAGDNKNKSEVKTMRYFKLNEEMNIRKTPNGIKVGVAPAGVVVSGTEFATNNGIQWIKTVYNGTEGYIAVLPESKGYAKEVSAPTTDYKALYETEKNRADALQTKLNKIKELVL